MNLFNRRTNKELVRLNVNDYADRERIVIGLINAGYLVRVEEIESERSYKSRNFYIIIIEKE